MYRQQREKTQILNNAPTGEKKEVMTKEIIAQVKALITNKGKDNHFTEFGISINDYGALCFIGIDTNSDGEIFYLEPIINQAPTCEKK